MEKEDAEEKIGEPFSGRSSNADPEQPEREQQQKNADDEIRKNEQGLAGAKDDAGKVEDGPKDQILPLDDQVSVVLEAEEPRDGGQRRIERNGQRQPRDSRRRLGFPFRKEGDEGRDGNEGREKEEKSIHVGACARVAGCLLHPAIDARRDFFTASQNFFRSAAKPACNQSHRGQFSFDSIVFDF